MVDKKENKRKGETKKKTKGETKKKTKKENKVKQIPKKELNKIKNKIKEVKIPKIKLNKLDKITKYSYKLSESDYKRHRALNEYIKSKKDQIKAAKDKKARLNVLRIYRKNKDPAGCRILTSDMMYIDRKYLGKGAVTKKIC